MAGKLKLLAARPALAKLDPNILIVASQFFNSAINFVVTIVLVRILGLSEFGHFSVYYVIAISAMSAIGALIVAPAASIAAAAPEEVRHELFSASGLMALAATGVIAFLAAVVQWALFVADVHISALPFAVLVGAMALNDLVRRQMLFVGAIRKTWVYDIVRFSLLGALLYWEADHSSRTAETTMLVLSAAYGLALLLLIPLSISALRLVSISHVVLHAKRILATGSWLSLSSLLQLISDNVFVVAGSVVAGTAAVGIFRVAQTLLGVVNPLFLALEHILPRRIGGWAKTLGWPTALRRYTETALMIGAAITAIIVTLGVFGEPLMIIAGGSGAEGFGWVVLGLGLVWVPYLVFIMIAFPLRAIERTRPIALSQAVSAVVALLIAVPLVGQFGLAGMILGMFISYAVGAGLLLRQYGLLRTAEYMQ